MLFAPGLIYINGSQKHYRNRSRVFIVCMLLPLPFSLSLSLRIEFIVAEKFSLHLLLMF